MATTNQRQRYDEYINSERWRLKRRNFFQHAKRNRRCAGCGYDGPGLEVHHKTYLHLGNEPYRDLVAVCFRCHKEIHKGCSSWSQKLSEHTDNVIAKIRRMVQSGEWATSTLEESRFALAEPRVVACKPRRVRKATWDAERQAKAEQKNGTAAIRDAMEAARSASEPKKKRKQPKSPPVKVGKLDPNDALFARLREQRTARGLNREDRLARLRKLNGL